MKLIRLGFIAASDGFSCRFQRDLMGRALSTNAAFANNVNANASSFETDDDFEKRIFSQRPDDSSNSFFKKIQRLEKSSASPGRGPMFDDLDSDFNSLTDGMEKRLRDEAAYFKMTEEVAEDDYSFRPDMNFQSGMTYNTKDLDLKKPGVWKPTVPNEFEVTTKEVLRKADFRNVRFLANFLTDAGIIIKRSQTKISAKAQRKVAREIKTARAFGLLPFTTMGTKSFVFGRTMQNLDEDYEHYSYDRVAGVVDEDVSPFTEANPARP